MPGDGRSGIVRKSTRLVAAAYARYRLVPIETWLVHTLEVRTLLPTRHICAKLYHLRAHMELCDTGQGRLATAGQVTDSLVITSHEANVREISKPTSHLLKMVRIL